MKLKKNQTMGVKVWLYDSPHPILSERSVVHTSVGDDGALYLMAVDPDSGAKLKMKMFAVDPAVRYDAEAQLESEDGTPDTESTDGTVSDDQMEKPAEQ